MSTKLVKHVTSMKLNHITIAVYQSPCIVTSPPSSPHKPQKPPSRALIVPANEELVGTALPYFPMAAPPSPSDRPTMSNWGGMEAGSSMFYPEQTIDGIVTRLGGSKLQHARQSVPVQSRIERVGGGGVPRGGCGSVRCPVGDAVVTPAYGEELTRWYDTLVHTVPPLFFPSTSRLPQDSDTRRQQQQQLDLLRSCWINSLRLALVSERCAVVTAPVGLGSGARGAPRIDAIGTAADSVVGFCVTDGLAVCDETVVVELVVRDERDVSRVIEGVEEAAAVRGVDLSVD